MNSMKKVLTSVCAIALALIVTVMPVSAAEKFSDVPSGQWYTESVERWSEAGLLLGNGGMFRPLAPITRAEMAQVVYGMLGLEAKTSYDSEFSDVPKNEWYYNAVMACADAGIIAGTGNGKFEPLANINRESAFRLIMVGLKVAGFSDEEQDKIDEILGAFSDGEKVSGWADNEVAAIIAYKGVSGNEDGNGGYVLRPQDSITRAEVAKILDRLVGIYVNPNGEISTPNEDEYSYNGSLVLVNGAQKDEWEVSYSGGELRVASKEGDKKAEIEVSSTEQAPTLIHGVTSATVKEDVKYEVAPPTAEDKVQHIHEMKYTECVDCSVDRTPIEVCHEEGDENCGEAWGETVLAHPHTFNNDSICTCCGLERDEVNEDFKFKARVGSLNEYVEAVVTEDYAAELTVTKGKVDAGNVAVSIEMQNVASLGITDKRTYTNKFSTGLDGDPELSVWLSNVFAFNTGTISANIEGKETIYTLEKTVDDTEKAVITATPASVDATRAAWQELTNHVTPTTQETDDAYIEIANGSYMTIGDDKLSFEKGVEENLKLDGFSSENGMSGVQEEIRSKVQLNTNEAFKSELYDAEFYLAAGTKLALGNSIATLDDNCIIWVSGEGLNSDDFANILPELKKAENGTVMAKKLVEMINAMVGSANNSNIDVTIVFEEPETEEKDTKFYFGMTANNTKGGKTTVDMEVYEDYTVEINIPMDELKAEEVTLDVMMKDVASLGVEGERKHSQTIKTGMTATGDLNTWMSNAPKFDWTSVEVFVNSADQDSVAGKYIFESDYDADWVTIKGDPSEGIPAAWHEIAEHFDAITVSKADSYFEISNKSYIDTANERLEFEDGSDNLKLDNFSDLAALKSEIKDSVKLVSAKEDNVTLFVGAGTTLAISNSVAELTHDMEIVLGGDELNLSENMLEKLQTASEGSNEALVKAFFGLLDELVGKVNKKDLRVDITFTTPKDNAEVIVLDTKEMNINASAEEVAEEEPTEESVAEEVVEEEATEEPVVEEVVEETTEEPVVEEVVVE